MLNEDLNIIYTVDDSYLPLVSISLASFQNNIKRNINVYIATDKDSSTENFKRLSNFHSNKKTKIFYIDCKEYDSLFELKQMNKWGSESFYIYWRLIVFNLLNVDKAIYIDSDILCLKEFEYPKLDNKCVGCVYDSVHACYNEFLNIENNFPLFNTGVMFVDVKKWKEKKCTEKCIDYINNVKSKFMMADQDLFSLALKDYIKVIDPKYNWFAGYDYYGIETTFKLYDLDNKTFYTKQTLKEDQKNVIFYHCLDGVFGRPWYKTNNHPKKKEFSFYTKHSAWPNYVIDKKISNLYKIESFLESVLPNRIYCKIHNYAIKRDIKKRNSEL